ncbi:Lar family restriction alleviation protein [Rahnella woolbedingensis]|uniref:Restriction alleviation protein, Lar family n=1 Tax=Rahnella woolbedingensis TaxID=1510574 RepID=A0A419N3E3_9GAMM|nr:Lar family restriction alleviation protein [Rahnella woolbedingensis]RJT37392.1 hypothetical protein D6C13_22265 [Rahnella woolbedingensis]
MKIKIDGYNAYGIYEDGIDMPLKPCPFCGSDLMQVENTGTACYWVECSLCTAQGAVVAAADEEQIVDTVTMKTIHAEVFNEAIRSWNIRF